MKKLRKMLDNLRESKNSVTIFEMKRPSQSRSAFVSIFILFLGCTQNPKQAEMPASMQAPVAAASPSPVAPIFSPSPLEKAVESKKPNPPSTSKKSFLAKLSSLQPKVDFRPKEEVVWQNATQGLLLDRHDAIQTQQQADARITFKSGSELNVAERTLIIIDKDPAESSEPKEDRVIIRDGTLVGKTRTELWILTSGGLVQLKPGKGEKVTAQAKVSFDEGKSLKIIVDSGKGLFINPSVKVNGAVEKVEIGKNVPVAIALKAPPSDAESMVAKAESSVRGSAPVTRAALRVSTPEQGSVTQDSVIEVGGTVTGSGCRVIINGKDSPIDADFNFKTQVSLNLGANLIVLQMIRPDGSVEFERRTIARSAR